MDQRKILLEQFEHCITRFSSRLEKLETKSRRTGYYRLLILIAWLIFFFISYFYLSPLFIWISAVVFLLAFGLITAFFNKIDMAAKKNRVWITIKKDITARMKIDWKNIPSKTFPGTDEDHPFETDLNITGKNSLHQLIDTSSSLEGSVVLKDWLISMFPDKNKILERQEIIKELIPLSGFRNRLLLNANLLSGKRLEGTKVSEWINSPSDLNKIKKILVILSIVIPINIFLILLSVLYSFPAYWTIGVLVYLGIYWFNSKHVMELFDKALDIRTEFGRFSSILEFLETYPALKNPAKPGLSKLCASFFNKKSSPSAYFKKLNRIVFAAGFQKNPFFLVAFNSIFPYDFFFAYKLELIKKEMKNKIPEWFDILYTLEACSSFSNFAFINPGYVFPVISDEIQKFRAEKIGHPLIPPVSNVHNDFSVDKESEAVIITGSNMSGKSTFLKTIGINLVLAFSGSVVNASALETSLYRIFTCININDSITGGISYFYAEVKRLKNLLSEIKDENRIIVFYLIDEIFKGTNNLERLIGSRSYIKTLAGLKGAGLISTHDLELVKLEESIPQVSNYHFKEEVAEGRMLFDYKLRRGPSPTTNALKIMEAVGLPVER